MHTYKTFSSRMQGSYSHQLLCGDRPRYCSNQASTGSQLDYSVLPMACMGDSQLRRTCQAKDRLPAGASWCSR